MRFILIVTSALALMTLLWAVSTHEKAAARPAVPWRSICLNALGNQPGCAVVMDISTGAVLACEPASWKTRSLPPGSLAKIVTAHAGLRTGAITPSTRYHCNNAITIRGTRYNCTVPGGHGSLDMQEALAQSCNIWFYQAARRIGAHEILRSWEQLGVNASSGASEVTSAERLAVGQQGPDVTATEMAALIRTVAMKRNDPQSPCRTIAPALRKAVTTGTATALSDAAWPCAGKTGSPEHIADPDKRHGWFIGWAPYDDPQIAIAVVCLSGNAYQSAVPVARRIVDSAAREKEQATK